MKHALTALLLLLSIPSVALAEPGFTRPFTGKDAADAVVRALVKEGAGDDLRVQINGVRDEDQIALATTAPVTAEAGDMKLDKVRGHWEATLYMSADGKNLAPARIAGRYDEMANVPVLRQRMQSGEVITEDDIVWDSVPANRLRKNTALDIKALVGKAPKRVVSAGRPIRLDEITGPTLVNKGAQVTLVYKTPSLEIKTLGEALENGSQGTVIRVKNSGSKALLQGTVESEGRVRVSAPDSLSAGLMP